MTYLLDTNTCIKYLNGRSENIRLKLDSARQEGIVVCSIVKAELFYGAMKSKNPQKNLANQNRFLERFISLPFDDDASKIYGEIRAHLEKKGTHIGPNDLLIAATALANNATLVTNNTREFGRVEGLKLEDWETLPNNRSDEDGK
jgi:tRNA(fMet)-specific endonuclease VapC